MTPSGTGVDAGAQADAGAAGSTNAPSPAPARPAAIRWPKFTVKGIIAGGAGTGSVILDKALIDVGQSTADGIRVIRLVDDGVMLEFKGQEQMFRVGTGSP
jgi:hypothetical protein